jgi:hypothetical protein
VLSYSSRGGGLTYKRGIALFAAKAHGGPSRKEGLLFENTGLPAWACAAIVSVILLGGAWQSPFASSRYEPSEP